MLRVITWPLRFVGAAALALGALGLTAYADSPSFPVSSSPNPSVVGETVTFTVPGSVCAAEGRLDVYDNGNDIGLMHVADGYIYEFNTPDLPVGTNDIIVRASAAGPACGALNGSFGEVIQIVNQVAAPAPEAPTQQQQPPAPTVASGSAPIPSPTPSESPSPTSLARAARTAADPPPAVHSALTANVASVVVLLVLVIVVIGFAFHETRLRRGPPGD